MSEQDALWFEKCKQEPTKYLIMVDNDCIWVEDIANYDDSEIVHEFSDNGQWFVIECLRQLGFRVSAV